MDLETLKVIAEAQRAKALLERAKTYDGLKPELHADWCIMRAIGIMRHIVRRDGSVFEIWEGGDYRVSYFGVAGEICSSLLARRRRCGAGRYLP